jgi:hypothetical protein
MSRVAALFLVLVLAGCTTAYRYVVVPPHLIPIQADPPSVYAVELECLTDETYLKLVEREQTIRFEIDQYRALLGRSP